MFKDDTDEQDYSLEEFAEMCDEAVSGWDSDVDSLTGGSDEE